MQGKHVAFKSREDGRKLSRICSDAEEWRLSVDDSRPSIDEATVSWASAVENLSDHQVSRMVKPAEIALQFFEQKRLDAAVRIHFPSGWGRNNKTQGMEESPSEFPIRKV